MLQWIRAGAKSDSYANVEPIIAKNCATCHQPGMPIVSLPAWMTCRNSPRAIRREYAAIGTRVYSFVRHQRHIFADGADLQFQQISIWFRTTFSSLPYLAILMDIGSW